MREIKFRAWDTEEKGWVLPQFYHDVASIMPITEAFEKVSKHPKELILGSCIEPIRVILMQYTGLKDKNGTEIYEGDILKGFHEGQVAEVVCFQDKDNYFPAYKFTLKTSVEDWRDLKPEYIEIIGNIYDNPELLDQP